MSRPFQAQPMHEPVPFHSAGSMSASPIPFHCCRFMMDVQCLLHPCSNFGVSKNSYCNIYAVDVVDTATGVQDRVALSQCMSVVIASSSTGEQTDTTYGLESP